MIFRYCICWCFELLVNNQSICNIFRYFSSIPTITTLQYLTSRWANFAVSAWISLSFDDVSKNIFCWMANSTHSTDISKKNIANVDCLLTIPRGFDVSCVLFILMMANWRLSQIYSQTQTKKKTPKIFGFVCHFFGLLFLFALFIFLLFDMCLDISCLATHKLSHHFGHKNVV